MQNSTIHIVAVKNATGFRHQKSVDGQVHNQSHFVSSVSHKFNKSPSVDMIRVGILLSFLSLGPVAPIDNHGTPTVAIPTSFNPYFQAHVPFDPHQRYNFLFSVSRDQHSGQESRDGDFVQGRYFLLDPDGFILVVTYTADSVVVERIRPDGVPPPSAFYFPPLLLEPVSEREFVNGVTGNNFPRPRPDQYISFVNSLAGAGIERKIEAAMYLAQLLHESGGLQVLEEKGCYGPSGCVDRYPAGGEWDARCRQRPPGLGYYGRGYIQLTWCSNYIQASESVGRDLVNNPHQVATDEGVNWGVTAWYWQAIVRPHLGNTDHFGLTTNAINGGMGGLECQGNGQNAGISRRRFQLYTVVFAAFGIEGTPNEGGCPY